MSVFIFLLVFVPLSLFLASRLAARGDRLFLQKRVIMAWLLLGPLVALVNTWMPFTEADDMKYFEYADPPIRSLADALDFSRFSEWYEQPGYPWLLSLLNSITGHDLLVYKYLNLFFLILLAITWYRIGLILESQRLARRLLAGVFFLTPLWYYVFFLLKDLSITLLQSVFILIIAKLWQTTKLRLIMLAVLTSLALLPLRTALIIQNGILLFGSLSVNAFVRGTRGPWIRFVFISVLVFASVIPLIIYQNALMQSGLFSESRALRGDNIRVLAEHHSERVSVNRLIFSLEYLLTETTALSPKSWTSLDPKWIRGVLALPWIFFIVPLFLLGLRWLLRLPKGVRPAHGLVARLLQSRFATTPWSIVLIFILVSFYISYTVGASTRWRLPDMPMITAIAIAGWHNTSPKLRRQLLLLWIIAVSLFASVFYTLRG